MEKQRTILLVAMAAICFLIYQRWVAFNQIVTEPEQIQQSIVLDKSPAVELAEDVPDAPTEQEQVATTSIDRG